MVRPDFIRFSMTAFAIVVQDECNSPVYRARDRILINPESPVTPGDDVVLGSGNDLLTLDELHLIPGQLTKMTATGWSLTQYADGHQRPFPIEQFPMAWKIVSRFMPGCHVFHTMPRSCVIPGQIPPFAPSVAPASETKKPSASARFL